MQIAKARYICCKENGIRTAWIPTEEFCALWNEISGKDDADDRLFYVLVCQCGFCNYPDLSPIKVFAEHWRCGQRDVQRNIWVPYLREHESEIKPIPPKKQVEFLEALRRVQQGPIIYEV